LAVVILIIQWPFKRFHFRYRYLKVLTEVAFLTSRGREFQMAAPEYMNDLRKSRECGHNIYSRMCGHLIMNLICLEHNTDWIHGIIVEQSVYTCVNNIHIGIANIKPLAQTQLMRSTLFKHLMMSIYFYRLYGNTLPRSN